MRSLSRSLFVVAALSLGVASLPACGGDTSSTDGGMSTDGGTSTGTDGGTNTGTDGGMNTGTDGGTNTGMIHHQSYVPSDERPMNAARLIVMGDSISAGYGTTNPSNPANMDTAIAYYSLLVTNDDALYPAEANSTLTALFNQSSIPVVNVAVPGATTTDMASSQPMALTNQLGATVSGHSIVVITIGGNDMLAEIQNGGGSPSESDFMQTIQTAVSNVRKVVTYLKNSTQFPDGVSIYLANVYDPSDGSGALPASCLGLNINYVDMDPGAVAALNDLSQAYIQLGMQMDFAVIDALGHFHGHGIYADKMAPQNKYYDAMDPNTWLYTDCIHPNDPGHNEMRRLFFEAIDEGHYTATED